MNNRELSILNYPFSIALFAITAHRRVQRVDLLRSQPMAQLSVVRFAYYSCSLPLQYKIVVDLKGLEPLTSSLRTTRSPS